MQHLLQFLYEHSFDEQLYCVLPCTHGELQLTWRADAPLHWQIRRPELDSVEEQPRANLIAYLTAQGADLMSFEHELSSLIAAHVIVADQLLAVARSTLGSDTVRAMLHGQEHFVHDLRRALTSTMPPRLRLVR